jgi:hypothetical protein
MVTQTQFQNDFLVTWLVAMNKMIEETETWADNMADQNPNFDYTSAQSSLASIQSSFESALETLQGDL